MMTGAQYVALMQHAVGANVTTAHDLWQTLNRAGRDLTNRRRWGWRLTGPTALVFVASNAQFALPTDYAELVEIVAADGAPSPCVRVIDVMEWLRARESFPQSLGQYWITVEGQASQATGTDEPTPVGRIHPKPTGVSDPALEIVYYRRWTELLSASPANVPNIPREFENLLLMIARAYTHGLEVQTDVWEQSQIKDEVQRLIDAEERKQPYVTMLRGGASSRLNKPIDDGRNFEIVP